MTAADAVPHVLVVESFDPDDATDRFTVEHPDVCPRDHFGLPACGVGVYEDYGIDAYFRHADDPDPLGRDRSAVSVGRHPIELHHELISSWPVAEYRSYLRLVGVRRG